MKKYLWIIGTFIGMGLGNFIWKNSKTYKKHQEEMKKSEEKNEELMKQWVKEAFPKQDYKKEG